MKKLLLAVMLASIPLYAQVPKNGGGGGASIPSPVTNGTVWWNGSTLVSTVGATGTLCWVQTDGGAPTWSSCAGTASTAWSSFSNPSANTALSMTSYTTALTWGSTTGSANLFSLADGSGNSGTGFMLFVNLASGSSMKPAEFAVNGNGVTVSNAGLLSSIGTGGINATQINAGAMPLSALVLASNSSNQPVAATLTSANIWVGNGSNAPAAVAVSGDVSMLNTGSFTVTKINNTAFSGTNGHLVSFGAGNIPADSGIVASNVGLVGNALSQFAATTSAQLAGVLSDETGSAGGGVAVFNNGPTLIAPVLGTPASGLATNLTGLPLTTGITGILGSTHGGSGVNNSATLTLGSSNVNLATLGTGIVKNTTTTGALTNAAAADIYGLFSGTHDSSHCTAGDGTMQICSGSTAGVSSFQTLTGAVTLANSNGFTFTPAGTIITPSLDLTGYVSAPLQVSTPGGPISGPTIVTSSSSLTGLALMVGAGGQAAQVSTGCSLDVTLSNLSCTGTISSGIGSGIAGGDQMGAGTLPTGALPAGTLTLLPPTSIATAYGLVFPGGGPTVANSIMLLTAASGTPNLSTMSFASPAQAMVALMPTATRLGDIPICTAFSSGNCTTWGTLPGNAGGTLFLSMNAGIASWTTSASSPAISSVSGATSSATGLETAAGDSYTFAGVETANLHYPFVFQNASNTNGNGSGALIVTTSGTGNNQTPLLINETTSAGDLIDAYVGSTITNGVLSGGSKVFSVGVTGIVNGIFSFPITVGGTVTQGGMPWFNTTTQASTSALLAANVLMKGGGSGAAPSTGDLTDISNVLANATATQTTTFMGGTSGASASALGGSIFTAASNSSTGGSGSVQLIPGIGTGAGVQGLIQLESSYIKATTSTVNTGQCETATMTVGDCSGVENIVGIAQKVNASTVNVVTHGQVFIVATAGVTPGDTVCWVINGGKAEVTDSGGTTGCTNAQGPTAGVVVDAGTGSHLYKLADGTTVTATSTLPLIQLGTPILMATSTGGSGIVSNCSTLGSLTYYSATGTTVNCIGTDITFGTHTLQFGENAIINASAVSPVSGFQIPTAAGAAPTADGFVASDSTGHNFVFGSNGATLIAGGFSGAPTNGGVVIATTTSGNVILSQTPTPSLGTDASVAGTLTLSNGAVGGAHTVIGSVATTSATFNFPATVPTNGTILVCTTVGTVCTINGGVANGNIVTATSNFTSGAMVIAAAANKTTSSWADFTVATHTGSLGASGILDLSAATGTAAFKLPQTTTNTATAAGVLDYDTTNSNYHAYNGADSVLGLFPTASIPATGHMVSVTVASSKVTLSDGGVIGTAAAAATASACTAAQFSQGWTTGSNNCTSTLGTQGTTAGSLTLAGTTGTAGSVVLNGGTSGSATLNVTATGGTLNLGSTNATVTSGGVLSLLATTNQIVLGAGSNLTTLNFGAPSGGVTITGPIVASGLAYATSQPAAGLATWAGSTYGLGTTLTPTITSATLTATTNQLVLGTTNTTTLNFAAPASSVTITGPIVASGLAYVAGATPSAGIAHFAGSTYALTSSTIATADIASNAVTSAKEAVVNTRRTCDIIIGDESASTLTTNQLGPQKRLCFVPAAATIVELDVAADAGTPSILLAVNHAGANTNITSSALATAGSGGIACANTAGTGNGIDGATACAVALNTTSIASGDYIEAVSGTTSTAKLLTAHVTYTIN